MKKDTIDLIKEKIFNDLKNAPDSLKGMFIKNWLRYKSSVEYVIETLPDPTGKRLLDYGCGHPFVTRLLFDLGYDIVGYEPYATNDEWQTAKWLGIDKHYLTQTHAGKTFDLILMIDVIEHLSIIKPIMEEIYNLTSPKGYLVVSTPNVMRMEMWLQFIRRRTGHPQPLQTFLESTNNYTHHQREFTMEELRQTVRHFGYEVILSDCISARDRKALEQYHSLLRGKPETPPLSVRIYKIVVDLSYKLFPESLANNLFLVGKKIGSP